MTMLMTLPEFAEAAALAVEASGAAPENRQAKAVPAQRMVRYYTSRGLLPRPGSRGRALVYGRRHLLQLVAIKRLQGAGQSLDDIAARLEGISDSELEGLAAVPAQAVPAGLGEVEDPGIYDGPRRASRFWEAVPASAMAPASAVGAASAPPDVPDSAPLAVRYLAEVRLTDSVSLMIVQEAGRELPPLPSPAALQAAAQPLLELLAPTLAAAQRKEDS